jgi:hypothetical protein
MCFVRLLFLLAITSIDAGSGTNNMLVAHLPSLQSIIIIDTVPLRVRVTVATQVPWKPTFLVDGLACEYGFTQLQVDVACLSLEKNRAVFVTGFSSIPNEVYIF